MPRVALVTGACGQDGWYLARQLAADGLSVVGVDAPHLVAAARVSGEFPGVEFVETDLTDPSAVRELVGSRQPAEIYNLAGVSFIPASWDDPVANFRINAGIPLNLLEAMRAVSPESRLFQACSSELFGDCDESPQTEGTPFHPRSPYSANKIHAFHNVRIFREYRGLYAVNGILYNHESPRRPPAFVTRKISRAVARIACGLETSVTLGGLDAVRDWGFAGDVTDAMRRMLRADKPEDFVIATGEAHTVREFCVAAFAHAGLDWEKHVNVDASLARVEHSRLVGDASKLRNRLGWNPAVQFEELVGMMVDHDLAEAKAEASA